MNPIPPRLASAISRSLFRRRRGFALVITMALMVLLMVLAVGLLGLSSIELRSSGANSAMAQARANARLALQIAIGELQLQAGPDTRITATSDIVGGKNRYTGVWNSRDLDPKSPGNLYDSKSTAFRKWLVSNADVDATKDQDFVKTSITDGVALVSEKTLGSTGGNLDQVVYGGRVPLSGSSDTNAVSGHYAYATLDDAVKARVDLGEVAPRSSDTVAKKSTSLGVGQSPGIDRVTGIKKSGSINFDLDTPEGAAALNKIVSLNQADLGYGANGGTFNERFHDLTTDSLGLMVDVAKGGFKKDLNLMAETAAPPGEYAGIGIYRKAFGSIVPANSDPSWGEALGYARLFNDPNRLIYNDGASYIRAYAPPSWRASTAGTADSKGNIPYTLNTVPPDQPLLLPSVAKVQVVFTFSAINIWKGSGFPQPNNGIGNHANEYAGYKGDPPVQYKIPSRYRYTLHMGYVPVVTLHNPYNVPIQFDRLRVTFKNVPFAIQLLVDGAEQYKDFVNFGQFLSTNQRTSTEGMAGGTRGQDKIFGFNITQGRLLPGEVKIYSPNIPGMENWSYVSGSWGGTFADTGAAIGVSNRKQEFISASEGWRGAQYGFDLDKMNGSDPDAKFTTDPGDGVSYNRNGYIALKPTSTVGAKISPLSDKYINTTKFTVEMRLLAPNEAADLTKPPTSPVVSAVEFDYSTVDGLQNLLMKDQPDKKSITAGPFTTASLTNRYDAQMKDWTGTTPFAIFSAYAKTTHARENGTNEDGSYAAKPWSLNNHTGSVAKYNVIGGKPAAQSHEINLQTLDSNLGDSFSVNQTGQSQYVTGHVRFTGRVSGTMHDVPLGPIQSIKDLNGANLAALATSPHFAAPLGNSFAHPMMNPSEVVSGELVDHSYLLNSIFYDGFYCSGIQTSPGGRDVKQIVSEFLEEKAPLTDRRFTPYFSDGATVASAKEKLDGNDGYKNSAAFMLMKGPFNVNSTSVEAWKAVLSGMSGKNAMALLAATGATSKMNELSDAKGARFSRFRLPNNTAKSSNNADAYWQGIIDLNEKQLTSLAEAIVTQVKERGPFLSLGEFINRRTGSADDKTLYGALQLAINNSGVNSDVPTDSQGNKPGYEISSGVVANYALANPKALMGPSAQGAPGFLTQADLMGVIGNAATVRADTFTIRAYGDSVDSSGKVLAKAYCEVVVQRMPGYCDPVDAASTNPPTAASNVQFGRRFTIRSFRWLSPDEV